MYIVVNFVNYVFENGFSFRTDSFFMFNSINRWEKCNFFLSWSSVDGVQCSSLLLCVIQPC